VVLLLATINAGASVLLPVAPVAGGGQNQSVDLPPGGGYGGWGYEYDLLAYCEQQMLYRCYSAAFEAYFFCRYWVSDLPTEGPNAHCWNQDDGFDCCSSKFQEWLAWCEFICLCPDWDAGRECIDQAYTDEMGCSGSYDEQWSNY
jgi:hypothetical protein